MTTPAELVARLRERAIVAGVRLHDEAADAIEALQAELAKAREEALAWRNNCTGHHGSQMACVNVACKEKP